MRPLAVILPLVAVIFLLGWKSEYSPSQIIPETETELGRKLFFDPILSADRSISCASCHKPEFGFADNIPFSFGIDSILTTRNTPSVKNVLSRDIFFWDGRAATLEEQALAPIENPNEMNLTLEVAIRRLREDKMYNEAFQKIYQREPDNKTLASAIAAFERSLESTFTPFDRYMDGDEQAISESAKRGRELFVGKANCFECHFGPDFTQDELLNIGIYDSVQYADLGYGGITDKLDDMGKFKVPSLRNAAHTAPYMHNGMLRTLREVIDYYDDPSKFITNPRNVSDRLTKPLKLTEIEKQDLEAFLLSLSDKE